MEIDRYHSAYGVPIAGHEAEMRRGKDCRNGHKRCPKEM